MKLIIIGEAAKHILSDAPEFLTLYPNVEWRQMAAMRNHIAHGYNHINYETVWDTVYAFLPGLCLSIDKILGKISWGESRAE